MSQADDVRGRFLGAIAEQLPVDSIAEVHLFQPIKQGGTESGVAVVAAERGVGQASASDAADTADTAEASSHHRLAVYTAKYRLTLKGPDRGKWDFSMQAEADAPLVTVDAVVRGVQRRSGDAQEPEKLTNEEFRSALPAADLSRATPSPS